MEAKVSDMLNNPYSKYYTPSIWRWSRL